VGRHPLGPDAHLPAALSRAPRSRINRVLTPVRLPTLRRDMLLVSRVPGTADR
jgi:hypothetical protein